MAPFALLSVLRSDPSSPTVEESTTSGLALRATWTTALRASATVAKARRITATGPLREALLWRSFVEGREHNQAIESLWPGGHVPE